LGDAFYRWDGFRYHSSFSEFLPSVALAFILWSIFAILTSMLIWLFVQTAEWLFQLKKRRINSDHLFLFLVFFGTSGLIVWLTKRFVLGVLGSTLFDKFLVFFCMFFAASFLTWIFRHKVQTIQERITPLVWLFGTLLIFMIPLIAYHAQWKEADNRPTQKINKFSSSNIDRPNIILITFDALTAENMSLYGYERPTTPFMSKWANRASVFTKTEAASTWTPPTVASLMLGKRVWTHQLYHSEGPHPVKSATENLPLLLETNGYITMAFILNQMHASPEILGIANNFHIAPYENELKVLSGLLDKFDALLYKLFFDKIRMYNWILKGDFILNTFLNLFSTYNETVTSFPPEKAFFSFLHATNNQREKPYFAWIHLYPPHHPYLAPEPYMGMFDNSSEFRTSKSQEDVIMFSIHRISQKLPNRDVQSVIDTLRARYDEFIRYSDKQFEDFIEQLEKRGKLKNTIIIISSDHGEGFEHNYIGHNGNFYEEQTHIPLIIKEPNQSEGMIIDELTEQVDIPATILDFAHIKIPSWMEGRSLVPILRGEKILSKPAFSMNFQSNPSRGQQIKKGGIAVWDGDYKLIHHLGSDKRFLFNLKDDPDELNNLFDKETEIGNHLLSLIKEHLSKANERIKFGE
jgi:arylsulfatase A-like enzyme